MKKKERIKIETLYLIVVNGKKEILKIILMSILDQIHLEENKMIKDAIKLIEINRIQKCAIKLIHL